MFPQHFTCVTHRTKAAKLAKRLTGASHGEVQRHLLIRQRLDAALGPPGPGWDALAQRMTLPWFLYESDEDTLSEERTTAGGIAEQNQLVPLPPARRRRSLTSFGGGMNLLLSCLEVAKDGVSRDDLRAFLKGQNPKLKDSSLGTIIYTLQFELGALRHTGDTWYHAGDIYLPTDRGLALLESGDPFELADWILTRILGVDHVIARLRDQGPTARSELVEVLRGANPGWKSDFGPGSMINWLRQLRVIDYGPNGQISLTEDGKDWADLIHWTPEGLEAEEEPGKAVQRAVETTSTLRLVQLPPAEQIAHAVAAAGAFPSRLVAKLHAGIWAHKRRHFAVLTGLSGTGKTLLARAYAQALHPGDPARQKDNLQIIAVQPGWYDPSPLLGYVNPLRSESYVRTPFLDFLIRAVEDPEHPYVAVLDEMNLSHPEQYLAPLLSAMESGLQIDLHREEEMIDGVPASLPYPPNLVLIGTVNMDETTHGLSDKVLDRAFTIEFWDIDLDDYPRWGTRSLARDSEEAARRLLEELIETLRPVRLHFGWRVVDDVLEFLDHVAVSDLIQPQDALDEIVYAKILPKLRGEDSPRFRKALEDCHAVLKGRGCTVSAEKVSDLLQDLQHTGTARFWR